jgi:hypothetical protein
MPRRFARLEPVPDPGRIEAETLARWDRDRVFERLREQNADGPTFSFIDGPVTANKVMGVHTAWGRTLHTRCSSSPRAHRTAARCPASSALIWRAPRCRPVPASTAASACVRLCVSAPITIIYHRPFVLD